VGEDKFSFSVRAYVSGSCCALPFLKVCILMPFDFVNILRRFENIDEETLESGCRVIHVNLAFSTELMQDCINTTMEKKKDRRKRVESMRMKKNETVIILFVVWH
jgi:hypothetical protein